MNKNYLENFFDHVWPIQPNLPFAFHQSIRKLMNGSRGCGKETFNEVRIWTSEDAPICHLRNASLWKSGKPGRK